MKLFFHVLAACAILHGQVWAATMPPRKTAARSQNVILITMDTLRADHVGCYGASQVKTPTLDALCHDGIVFDRAFSQVPLTWPSHAAIFTGTYPFQNGVQDFTGQPLSPQFHTLAEAFKRHGYATGAVISAFVLDRSWGLSRGFDFYDDAFPAETFKKKDIGLVDRRAEESVTHAINWLKRTPRHPFFLWLHLYDPHSPYDPPEPYFTQYQGHLYDGEIAYADNQLGRLISWLKKNQLYEGSAIIFLSDHGESLGEHGESEHGFFIYNATIRIPLIVKPPAGSRFRPGRFSRPVETIAVPETFFQLAAIKDPIEKQFQAPSLLSSDRQDDRAAYSETFYPFSSFGWSPLHSLQTARFHYIEAPTPELYDVLADPEEKNNLAAQLTGTVAVLKDRLQQRLGANPFATNTGRGSAVDPETAEKLRALGYVAYSSPVSAEALAAGLPDPKSKIEIFNAILKATDALRAGDFEHGHALLAQAREQEPHMYVLPFMLGEAALQQQNWNRASAEFRECLDMNPNFDQAMTGLARALMYQNKNEEAKQWTRNALKINPQNYRAWYELGFIEARSNDRNAAITDYKRALAIQGNFAPLRRDLGLIYYEEKNYSEAAEHLAKAASLGMEDPLLFNNLGISYSQTGRQQKAIESYRQALKLDPNLAQAHLNLAYAYQQLHRGKEAEQEYQAACRLQAEFCRFVPNLR